MSAIKPKILVIRGGAIGDFILTLPAIAALRRQFPQAHLEVLGYPHIAQLAVAGGLADRVQPIEARGLAGFFARGGTLEPDLVDYFSEFDLVISYLYDPDGIFKTNSAAAWLDNSLPVRTARTKRNKPMPRKFISSRWSGSPSLTPTPCRVFPSTLNPQPSTNLPFIPAAAVKRKTGRKPNGPA